MTPARSPTTPPPTATMVEPRSRPAPRHCRQPSSSASQLLLPPPAATAQWDAPRTSARELPNIGMVVLSPITSIFDAPARRRSRPGTRPSRPASMLTGEAPDVGVTWSSAIAASAPDARAPGNRGDLAGHLADLATGG